MATKQELSTTNNQSALLDKGNQPYSDSNPPQSLEMTQAVAPAGNPPAGEAVLWTVDGKALMMKAPDGTLTTIGPSAGGGGGSGTELSMTTDYISPTNPTSPATGLKLFSRNNARRLPSFVGPTGQDSRLAPHMGTNRVGRLWFQPGNGAMSSDTVPHVAVTPIAVSVTNPPTNLLNSVQRGRFTTTTTVGNAVGVRVSQQIFHFSSNVNQGGFHAIWRFGVSTAVATSRHFSGLWNTTTQMVGTTDPTTVVNTIGFGWNAADTAISFMTNDSSGAATKHATTTFLKSDVTALYEAEIFCPSGAGQQVFYSLRRCNDGVQFRGGPITTDLPALNLQMAWHFHLSNGTTGAAFSMDFQNAYFESDN